MEKIKVLFYDHGPSNACSYLRGRLPAKYLGEEFETRFLITNEIAGKQVKKDEKMEIFVSDEDIKWADIIVFERFYSSDSYSSQDVLTKTILTLIEMAKDLGKKIVYETDDLLHEVDPENPSYATLNPKNTKIFSQIESLLKNCDLMITTTELLGEEYKERYGIDYAVCPNSVESDVWFKAGIKQRELKDKIRIGWSGGGSHKKDIEMIKSVLVDIANDYKDKVQLVLMGFTPTYLDEIDNIEFYGFCDYLKYPEELARLNLDIGLIPLEDTLFNRSKSNIKWLEYSALGIASIASKIPPYSNTMEHEYNCLLVKNRHDKWYSAIKRLIDDEVLRQELGATALNHIADNYDIYHTVKNWQNAYKSLIK